MLAGLRVIRGPGWKQGDADGGEGHVGTVVGAKDDGTVEVTWDGGQVSKVKAGTNEVLVLDNATVGVRHADHTCDECQESGIVGLRWRCTQCEDYDLCSLCYFGDTHDCGHQFDRYETSKSKPERMEKRNKSTKIRVMGIYPEATVTRGRDWEWGDQDGGPGSEGHVLDIITPATNSARSTVKVEWTGNMFKNVYRVGFKGKVDLQYSEEAPGGECYPHHLPVLDPKNYTVTSSASTDAAGDVGIAEGDRVVITVGVDKLQELQKSRSGWAVGMTQCVGKVGDVKGFAANGDAIVGFGPKKYRLVPQALKKVANISTGDHVRVIEDDNKVKVFQDGHGGFNDDMKSSLGKVGEVIKMDSDGDVVVQFGQQKWLFNPACLTPAPGAKLDTIVVEPSARSRPSFDRAESSLGALNQLLGAVFLKAAIEAQVSMPQKLMIKAVIENDITGVKRLVDKDKALVHAEEQGVSALHLAANQGNLQITQILVENGAKLDGRDSDGDSPLMAGMKHEPVVEFLMTKGCGVTVANDVGQTPAHKAAFYGHHNLLRKFITKGADMNVTDVDGDTPLHDAINQGRHSAAEVLIGWPKIDVRRKNKKGFSPLQFCAIKDTATIAELLLKKDNSLVDEQKEDGFTALHVAAINNHSDVMKVLLETGKAKVDVKTVKKQTALHVAAEQAYMDAVQVLIQHGADVNAKDSDGDRPLHVVLGVLSQTGGELGLLLTLLGQTPTAKEEERVRIACYLLQAGADPESRNDQGKTALDVCTNQTIADGVNRFLTANPALRKPQKPKTPALVREMSQSAMGLCRKCVTKRANILFVPCGHKAACEDCTTKHKLRACPQCGVSAKSRFDENGKEIGCVVM